MFCTSFAAENPSDIVSELSSEFTFTNGKRDTIIVDGSPLLVKSSVVIDTIASSSTTRSTRRHAVRLQSGFSFPLWTSVSWGAALAPNRQVPRVHSVGFAPPIQTLDLQLQSNWNPSVGSVRHEIVWGVGLQLVRRWDVVAGISAVDDSTIGFIPQPVGDIWQVTQTEFPQLGIETDTLSWSAPMRWGATAQIHWGYRRYVPQVGWWSLQVGLDYTLQPVSDATLYAPESGVDEPFQVRELSAGSIRPRLTLEWAKKLGERRSRHWVVLRASGVLGAVAHAGLQVGYVFGTR